MLTASDRSLSIYLELSLEIRSKLQHQDASANCTSLSGIKFLGSNGVKIVAKDDVMDQTTSYWAFDIQGRSQK